MPPILVISDIHASDRWRKMLADRSPETEVIFLGDYFDRRGRGPFARSQVENFIAICHYAEKNPPVTLLIGNHDYNYTPWALGDVAYEPDAYEISQALISRISMLEMVAIRTDLEKPVIFSHGGLTATFMRLHGVETPADVNRLWRLHPEAFEWIPADPLTGARSNRYGDDPWQSPIWARTEAIYTDGVPGYDQVVGHTIVREVTAFETRHGDTVLMTCTLDDEPVLIPANSDL